MADLEPLRQLAITVVADGLGLGVAWAAIIGAVAAWDAWTRRRRRPR